MTSEILQHILVLSTDLDARAREASDILRAQRRLLRDVDALRRELVAIAEVETTPATSAALAELEARLQDVVATAALDRDLLAAKQRRAYERAAIGGAL